MTTLTNICRYSIPKTSTRLVLIPFNSPGVIHSVTTFPTSFNLSKHSVFLTQNNYNAIPGIQSATFATSIGRFQESKKGPQHKDLNPTHIASDKNVDAFSKLEKAAKSESFHFQKKNKEVEDGPKELIPVSDDAHSQDYLLPHPIWSEEEVKSVEIKHTEPRGISDRLAYIAVQIMRKTFDLASGYTIGKHFQTLDERSVLVRCIFLETVAGVPGFTAAMVRHLHSLRRMQRDHGWIHTLLEEAENERMHLMTFLQLKNPGPVFRFGVVCTQYVFTAGFFLAYLASPKFCHRFVGYLEEEAVKTYSHIIEEIDAGRLPMWKNLPAPDIAVQYWQLPDNHTMRDVILAVRADEAHHRDVNHVLASMKLRDKNPFKAGE